MNNMFSESKMIEKGKVPFYVLFITPLKKVVGLRLFHFKRDKVVWQPFKRFWIFLFFFLFLLLSLQLLPVFLRSEIGHFNLTPRLRKKNRQAGRQASSVIYL